MSLTATRRRIPFWLITWTTFGTWLPGDPRGFQTWRGREYVPPPPRYARPGEPTYNPADYARTYRAAEDAMTQGAVRLTPERIVTASDALAAECGPAGIVPAVWALGPVHAHLLARFGPRPIRPTAGRLKAAATRALHEAGFAPPRLWCRNVHMTSKPVGEPFEKSFEYVANHAREGARVVVWPEFMANVLALDDDVRGKLVAFPPPGLTATASRRLGGSDVNGDLSGSDFDPTDRTPR